jgi:hypothetical protein
LLPTAQRAVAAYAARELGEPKPTPLLGIDETRFGRPRWIRAGDDESGEGRWVRLEPWETGFVDLRCPQAGGQGLLGQVDGRSSAAVLRWLAERSEDFRGGVEIVAVDPSAPYAAAVRDALPAARVAVDHFHLVALANQAVTAVRQRVTREQLGRRGRRRDPVWANRRLLLRGRERLSARALARMWNGAIDHEPTGQLLAAWIAKEELRALLALAAHRDDPRARESVRRRLWAFYSWCADTDIPELHTLAATIEAWWPAVEVFLSTAGHQRPHRGHQPTGQAGQTRRLRIPQPRQLPHPSTVALHSINTTVRSVNQPAAHSRSVSVSLRCSGKEDHQARRR